MTIIGFTGTRMPITDVQRTWLMTQLQGICESDSCLSSGERARPSELHHGACINADFEAHRIANQLHIHCVVHPPTNPRYAVSVAHLLDPLGGVTILEPRPYLVRNRNIVDAATVMLALPNGPERTQSGTWSTIRYSMSAGKPVSMCYPDGSLEER